MIAVVCSNTLAAIGLQQLLHEVMPFMHVRHYMNTADVVASVHEYAHLFVDADEVDRHLDFYNPIRHKVMVLTSNSLPEHLNDYHFIRLDVPEEQLVKSILALEQYGHPNGTNLPQKAVAKDTKLLSQREVQVLTLVAEGYLNKQIADKLNISISTVISHRKNIQEKLKLRTVSALTIYAVMHGYVDVNRI